MRSPSISATDAGGRIGIDERLPHGDAAVDNGFRVVERSRIVVVVAANQQAEHQYTDASQTRQIPVSVTREYSFHTLFFLKWLYLKRYRLHWLYPAYSPRSRQWPDSRYRCGSKRHPNARA